MSAPIPTALILAETPERLRLGELQAEAEALRDAVAALDLDIETLRSTLSSFDARAHGALRDLHLRHERVAGVVRHLERWQELLERSPREELPRRARRLDAQRARELEAEPEEETLPFDQPGAPVDADVELKSLYRRLARRYHPDLARDEEEQCRAADVMVRINGLYRAGDLAGLRVLADQALGAEPAEEGLTLEREIALLAARCERFADVLEGLQEELAELKDCPTARLWRGVTEHELAGRDAFAELRAELGARTLQAYENIRVASRALEEAVRRFNRNASLASPEGRRLGRVFDAHLRQPLIRLSLEGLAVVRSSPEVRRRAEALVTEATERPAVLRLVLFTYAAELVPHGLESLSTLEALRLRFDAVAGPHGGSVEEALAEAAELLEMGIRRAGPRAVQTGLRFRDATLAAAVPLALRSHVVRGEFRRILSTLGEEAHCPGCATDVFAVPLYRLRGLDDLHASVCPRCGHLLKSYWMPRGKDVQAVLNEAFLDLELVTEWTFRLGRASVSTQLLPAQLESFTVGALKARFVDDVLTRHGVDVAERQVRLLQAGTAVPARRSLEGLCSRIFSVAFAPGAKVSLADALERVRFRIRTRFRPEPPAAAPQKL